jgi:quercetin dioxygenase-like cupin family protein
MQLIDGAGVFKRPAAPLEARWVEQFRVPDLSVGTYCLVAGATDDQGPHTEDEIYLITSGRASFEGGGRRVDVGPGSVIFVPAREAHRFVDITEDLAAFVMFGPAEGSRSVTHIVAFVTGLFDAYNAGVASGDFARLLAMFTADAVVRLGRHEYAGRPAFTTAYLQRPPDEKVELTSDPREEEGSVYVDFVRSSDQSPGTLRLVITDDDLISRMEATLGAG